MTYVDPVPFLDDLRLVGDTTAGASIDQQAPLVERTFDGIRQLLAAQDEELGPLNESFGLDVELGALVGGEGVTPDQLRERLLGNRAATGLSRHAKAGFDPHVERVQTMHIERAQTVFGRYGTEISAALLLAALPQAYAAGNGARVLARAQGLERNTDPRVRRTAEFLLKLMVASPAEGQPANPPEDIRRSWRPGGTAFEAIVALRAQHELIRRRVLAKPEADGSAFFIADKGRGQRPAAAQLRKGNWQEVPINQEDLLGMLLTFSITTFEVLAAFNIQLPATDQDAYLHLWRRVGQILGVGDAYEAGIGDEGDSFLPETVTESRRVLGKIRNDQWASSDGGDEPSRLAMLSDPGLESGRRLIRALLNELASSMPPLQASWPLAVMRQLADARVRDRLGLGDSGLFGVMLDALPEARIRTDNLTVLDGTNPIEGMVLRRMANAVVQQTLVHFITAPESFAFPEPFGGVTTRVRERRQAARR